MQEAKSWCIIFCGLLWVQNEIIYLQQLKRTVGTSLCCSMNSVWYRTIAAILLINVYVIYIFVLILVGGIEIQHVHLRSGGGGQN